MKNYKSASVYLRENKVIMYPENETTDGVGVSGEPVLVLDTTDFRRIGESIVQTLDASGKVIFHPSKWKSGRFDYVLKAAGVRSYKEFVKGAKNISIAANGNEYTLQPTKNGGVKGSTKGFGYLPHKNITINTADLETLGNEVITAFDKCE